MLPESERSALTAEALKGRNILITGATGGLGRATALRCAQHGATVILLGRNVKKLEAVYDEIIKAKGPTPAIIPMNLLGVTWSQIAETAELLEREFSVLHGLVHCAAHFTTFAPLESLSPKDWMDSLQVNLTSAYALTRECLPLLAKADQARIIFVSEAAALDPKPLRGAYGLAKIAIEGMIAMWSPELEIYPGIRISRFDPGPMRTDLRRRGYPSGHDRVELPDTAAQALLALLV